MMLVKAGAAVDAFINKLVCCIYLRFLYVSTFNCLMPHKSMFFDESCVAAAGKKLYTTFKLIILIM